MSSIKERKPSQAAIIILLCMSLLVVCAITLLSHRNIEAVDQAQEQYKISQGLMNLRVELLSMLTDAETGQRGFLLTGEEEYLEPYNQAILAIPQLLDRFKFQAVSRPDQAENIRNLEPIVLARLDELRESVEFRRSNTEPAETQLIPHSIRGKMLMDEIRKRCAVIEQITTNRLAAFSAAEEESSGRLRIVSILGSGLLFVFLIISALAVFRSMSLYKKSDAGKKLLETTLESIGDAVITTDKAGNVTYLNPVAETMTGWTSREANGLPLQEVFQIINSQTDETAPNPVERVLQQRQPVGLALHTVLIQRGGKTFPIEDSAAPILDQHGDLIGAVLVFHDVTHALKMATQLTHQASHDALTGLINRREFERRLEHALLTAQVDATVHTMLYLDLDQFKIVNDTCGHLVGDELLRQLTNLLQTKLRKNDALARLGGDEFGVLLENCPTGPALDVADQLRQAAYEFHFVWKDRVFQLGLSIGLVTFSDGKETLADILRMTDAACYLAKDKGRNRIQIYTPGDTGLAKRRGEMGWVGRIQKALDEQRFVLYSQKILPLMNGIGGGEHYELLLRLKDEDGMLIPPMAFIPAAERYGLMPQLDRWVVATAFAQHRGRHLPGAPAGTCAINLSGTSVCDENFYEFVTEQFDRYKISPGGICFEITETSAIANLTQATELIGKLKNLGCRFSLDDFGSGMSSFTYLKHLPVDYLKIDGEFVKDMVDDPIDHAMVEAINSIGHVMHIETIAEFVENNAILDALRKIGVDYAQGYGIEKPRLSDLLHTDFRDLT
jgi:diguanylate cyclase (GGDEF)-like protein/PAS domain S-box-containing protein